MNFWEGIKDQLQSSGFFPVKQKENWYWRAENPVLYLLCLWDGQSDTLQEDAEAFMAFGRDMEHKAERFHCTRVVALSVLVDKKSVDNFVDNVDNFVYIGYIQLWIMWITLWIIYR